jgi:hypothetical protein
LRKLLGFWQRWPDLVAGQQLIICLLVEYEMKGRKRAKKLSLDYLKEILITNRYRPINTKIYREIKTLSICGFRQFDRIYSVVLPELTGVSKSDMREWVDIHVQAWVDIKETTQFVRDEMTQKLITKIREKFDSWERETLSNKIPMAYLAEDLESILKALIDERGLA